MFSQIFQLCLCRLTNNILSTAQQVWLQKLGGAKNLVGTNTDDVIKEEKLQIQKSVSELDATKEEVRRGEKLTSEGPRPGERLIFVDTFLFIYLFYK